METILLILGVLGIHFLALISPGPDFIMVVKNAVTSSRKAGIYTSLGLGIGAGVHILYSSLGLAILISQSIILFNIIKFLGAAYLIYIGIKSLLAKSSPVDISENAEKTEMTPLQALQSGFLTNILNPKATLFFLSLFTLVITPETPVSVVVFVSIMMIINTSLWFILVTLFFTQKKVHNTFKKFAQFFNKVFGGLLVALGVKVALSGK